MGGELYFGFRTYRTTLVKHGELRLGISQFLFVLRGLLVEELELPWRAMDRQMFSKIQIVNRL